MRGKRFLAFLVIAVVLLCGCGSSSDKQKVNEDRKTDKIQIGMAFDSFVIERWVRDRDVFVSTATKLGADVNVQNANGDVQEQISQIEYFIEKNMDVIVVVAVDCEKLTPVMQKAKKVGIRTICYDRLVSNANADLYISFDNVKVGTLIANALQEALPDGGKIFCIKGSMEDNNVALVEQGFQEAIANSTLEVVYEANCKGWLAEEAFDYVTEALAKYPNVAGVMCGNDDLASYAFRALAENRKAGKVMLIGQDADLAACQRIVEGTQYMTVYKSVDSLAGEADECAVKLAKGEPLGAKETISDGENEIPFQKLEPVAVTRENMDEIIIDGGFHLKEDVYLNINK